MNEQVDDLLASVTEPCFCECCGWRGVSGDAKEDAEKCQRCPECQHPILFEDMHISELLQFSDEELEEGTQTITIRIAN